MKKTTPHDKFCKCKNCINVTCPSCGSSFTLYENCPTQNCQFRIDCLEVRQKQDLAWKLGRQAFADYEKEKGMIIGKDVSIDQNKSNLPNPGWNFGSGNSGCVE